MFYDTGPRDSGLFDISVQMSRLLQAKLILKLRIVKEDLEKKWKPTFVFERHEEFSEACVYTDISTSSYRACPAKIIICGVNSGPNASANEHEIL